MANPNCGWKLQHITFSEASGAKNSLWDISFYVLDHFCLFGIVHCSNFRADWTALLAHRLELIRFLKKKGSRSKNWDKVIFSKIQRWGSLPLLSCTTSMNALKFLEIVTNQLLKSFSVRTKFYTSNISQFHLKREILNQIGSNNSAKFSIYLKTIPEKWWKHRVRLRSLDQQCHAGWRIR